MVVSFPTNRSFHTHLLQQIESEENSVNWVWGREGKHEFT